MFLHHNLNVLLSRTPVDMRKSIDGLSILVADLFQKNPISDYLFVFRNRYGDKIKILYWNCNGYCLFYKRLERGRFKFPSCHDGCFEITTQQLNWLLDGLDFMTLKGHSALHYEKHY